MTILEDAADMVDSKREAVYGEPDKTFREIAGMWSEYLTSVFGKTAVICDVDVAHMMILLKVVRNAQGLAPNRDNLVDIAGYARCLERIYHDDDEDEGNEEGFPRLFNYNE